MEERRVQVIKGDPDRWCLQDTLRVAGEASLVFGCVRFPLIGGDSQDKDLLAILASDELAHHRLVVAAVALVVLGPLVFLVSLFVGRDEH